MSFSVIALFVIIYKLPIAILYKAHYFKFPLARLDLRSAILVLQLSVWVLGVCLSFRCRKHAGQVWPVCFLSCFPCLRFHFVLMVTVAPRELLRLIPVSALCSTRVLQLSLLGHCVSAVCVFYVLVCVCLLRSVSVSYNCTFRRKLLLLVAPKVVARVDRTHVSLGTAVLFRRAHRSFLLHLELPVFTERK